MFIDEFIHFVLSVAIGLVVGKLTGNFWAVPLAIASGFFLDADHLIDYFIHRGWKFNINDFFSGKHFDDSGKVYVFFHGFEFAIILIVLSLIFPNLGWLFFSLGFANLFHLFYDTFCNGAVWPTYFLTFRIAKNFDHKKLWIKNEK
ncbi:MAG: hypothetical protein NTW79_01265 [Candidatus Berkelbacteria bacterium]|nr:hypothetical protein [Candidatus Berkelbacteria bacterium]